MWTAIKRQTEPAIEPVTKQNLKNNLRLDGTDQDDLLDALIQACRESVEALLHRTCISTTYTQKLDSFSNLIELYRPPVQSVTSIKYYDSDNTLQTLSTDDYEVDLDSLPPRIKAISTFPSTYTKMGAIEIEFIAGYGDAVIDVPEAIKQAIILLASDLYEHPEANVELKLEENRTLQFLLAAYKVPFLGGDNE